MTLNVWNVLKYPKKIWNQLAKFYYWVVRVKTSVPNIWSISETGRANSLNDREGD